MSDAGIQIEPPEAMAAGHRHMFRAGADGGWVSVGPSFLHRTGLDLESCLGSGWMRVVHGSDRDALRSGLAAPDAGAQALAARARLWSAPQNRFVPSLFFAEAVIDPDGAVREWIGSITDAFAQSQAGGETFLCREEVRDVLSTVRTILSLSAETASDVAELAIHLDGRLTALARIRSALLRRPGAGLPLFDIAMDELRAFAGHGERHLRLDGPDVRLGGRQAELVALALHELATNAVKFGSLRSGTGRIALAWSVERGERLVIRWCETGAAPAGAPRRSGFGTDFLTRILPDALTAKARAEWRPDGVCWTIDVPLEDARSSA
ncbi:HWE histidine kinase domain-containing protein [Aureimonas sp. SK2]|uniref:HWE histidine kinase domain-containing protein n=1 Tax=Aureimonas sp. SK2 TaxID=3015992 RepID=UPI0024437CA3|nr:HWE histidine kinase domain-containing protein [Aureimonas sp. SK2]